MAKQSRLLALAEVLAVYVAILAAIHYLLPHGFRPAQLRWFGYPFLTDTLLNFGPVVLVWAITRRPAAHLGLSVQGWRAHLWTGVQAGIVFSFFFGPPHGLIHNLGTSRWEWLGGSLISLAALAALPLVMLVLRRRPGPSGEQPPAPLLLASALPAALVVGIGLAQVSRLAAGVVSMAVFVSLGEELLCRGYFQSRLNAAFGRPFSWWGVPWGWGLVIAAVLFGAMHPLALATPCCPALALPTTVAGVIFGLVREKTGSVYAAAACHAVGNVISLFVGTT